MELMVTQSSGVRLEFATTARALELDVMITRAEFPGRKRAEAVFDLILDEADIHSASAAGGNRLVIADLSRRNDPEFVPGAPATVRFDDLPRGHKRCELWLPSNAIVELRALRVEEDAGSITGVQSVTALARIVPVKHGPPSRRAWPTSSCSTSAWVVTAISIRSWLAPCATKRPM